MYVKKKKKKKREIKNQEWEYLFVLDKFVKRVPQRLPTKKNDIYVSRKTKYFFLYKHAKKLLDEGYAFAFLFSLSFFLFSHL